MNPIIAIDSNWAIYAPVGNGLFSALSAVGYEVIRKVGETSQAGYRSEAAGKSKPYQVSDRTAVIPIQGTLTKVLTCAGWMMEATATVDVRRALRAAVKDPDIDQIALFIDSPGGQVSGTGELANDVARANSQKRVVAYCDDMCASAAYWIASQCDAVYANSSALVGSIGTYMCIEDWSRAADAAGVKVHVVKAGEFKGSGTPGTPVTGKQIANFQSTIDDLNAQFLSAVQRGRKLTSERVSELNDGRVFVGQKAVEAGLVDEIRSFDTLLSQLSSPTPPENSSGTGATPNMSSIKDRISAAITWALGNAGAEELDAIVTDETPKVEAKAKVVSLPEDVQAALAAVPTLQSQIATLTEQLATERATRETERKSARLETAKARIEAACADLKLKPFRSEGLTKLAESNPDAFDAAMNEIEANDPIEHVTGRIVDATTLAATAQGATKEFMDAVAAHAKEHGSDYVASARAVSALNPSLAERMREEQLSASPAVGE